MDSTSALELESVPGSLLVVGGGYIGLELGSVYAALGSKVTVVEMTPGLLPGADRDLVDVLAKKIDKAFDKVLLSTKVVGVTEQKDGLKVTFEDASGARRDQVFDKVLVSVGRKPNQMPGLDKTKVEVDARGFIKVNGRRQTAEPTIYAIGDIAGDPMLAHKAQPRRPRRGRGHPRRRRGLRAGGDSGGRLHGSGTGVGRADRDRSQARRPQGRGRRSSPGPRRAASLTLDRTDGLTKLVIEPGSERVLGVGIVGPGAGELIAEGTLAIEMGAVVIGPQADDSRPPDAVGDGDGVGRDVLRPRDARLQAEKKAVGWSGRAGRWVQPVDLVTRLNAAPTCQPHCNRI